MASYGVFQAVCGFNCHGPHGHLEFAPRLGQASFRAAFTSAAGWGSIGQERDEQSQTNVVEVKHGHLRLKTLAIAVEEPMPSAITALIDDKPIAATFDVKERFARVELDEEVVLQEGQTLKVSLT